MDNCKESEGGIKKIYIMNSSDVVFENGVMVRMKRKYGKFTRPVYTHYPNEELSDEQKDGIRIKF